MKKKYDFVMFYYKEKYIVLKHNSLFSRYFIQNYKKCLFCKYIKVLWYHFAVTIKFYGIGYQNVHKGDLWTNIYHSLNVAVKVYNFGLISSLSFLSSMRMFHSCIEIDNAASRDCETWGRLCFLDDTRPIWRL